MPSNQVNNEHWGFIAAPTNVLDFVHDRRLQNLERKSRERLAQGIPANALQCQLHRANLSAQSEARHQKGPTPEPEVRLAGDNVLLNNFQGQLFPDDPIAAAPNIAMTTTLLPCCLACFLNSNNLPDRTPVPEGFDSCSCATNILGSKCVICTIVGITNRYNTAVAERIRLDDNDKAYIACECGNHTVDHAPDVELIRRCAGCGGTVTFPFRNWEGSSLVFKLRLFGVEWAFPSDEMVARQLKLAPPESLLNGVDNIEVGWMEEMQPKRNTSINDHEGPFVYVRWEAEKARERDGGQVLSGQSEISPGDLEQDKEADPDVAMRDPENEQADDQIPDRTAQPEKQAQPANTANNPQQTATNSAAAPAAPAQQLPGLPSFAALATNPNMAPVITRNERGRRTKIHNLVKDAGFMGFGAISRAVLSCGFTQAELKRILKHVKDHHRNGVDGARLVNAIERGLKKLILN